MSGKPALLIFDIDGTLTHSAGLTRVAFELAVKDIYNISNSTQGINPFGRTDKHIFREILSLNNLPDDNFDVQFERFSQVSTEYLERQLKASDQPRLHNGVRDLLKALSRENDIYLALGTGNIKENAYLKLERHNIVHLFPVGGFGSDDEDRTSLLRIAHRRACEYYCVEFDAGNCWVIGDTPQDIAGGRNIGAETIGVATGTYSEDELRGHGPTAVFSDLTDRNRFMNLILDKRGD